MPSNFAVTPYSTTTLPDNTFPVSAVFVPGTASGNLTAVQGGPSTTDGNSYTSAPMAVYTYDGNNVALGTTTDLATANTLIGLSKAIKANTANVAVGSLPALPAGTNTIGNVGLSAGSALIGGVELVDSGGTNKASISAAGAVKVDNSAVTQPVSAASLPLPSGAATAAKQPALGTAGTPSADVLSVQGIASMTPLKVDGSGATQPISGSVSVSNFPATQPISGTVTANQGGAPWSNNVTQFGGSNVATGTGTSGAGIPRVTVANDSNVLATQSGTWTEQPVAGTTGGATTTHLVSASGNNATNVKASAGLLYGFSISNTNASARYVHFYNKATAPVVGTDVPVATVQVTGNGVVIRAFPVGATYGTGIGFGTSTGAGDTDSGAIGAGDLVIDLEYK